MDDHQTPIRVVVKKKKGHEGRHGGAWKVAYADFVTAMMALFIVLWIIGQNTSVKQAISAYFKDPGVFDSGRGGNIFRGSHGFAPDPTIIVSAEIDKLKAEAKKLQQAIKSNADLEKFKDKIEIAVTKEGLRIELLENSAGVFFDVGSSRPKPDTVKLLKLVGKKIGELDNKVMVEGYTDARPYVNPDYTNWELSADRANTARRILEQNGVQKGQVSQVRGFADRNLKHPDKPLDFANRRVSILVATGIKEPGSMAPRSPTVAPQKAQVVTQEPSLISHEGNP